MNVTLKEGYKRQIREMGKVTGLLVVRIVRVRIGELRLGNLKPREWRYLTAQEVDMLKSPQKVKKQNPLQEKPTNKAGTRNQSNESLKTKGRP